MFCDGDEWGEPFEGCVSNSWNFKKAIDTGEGAGFNQSKSHDFADSRQGKQFVARGGVEIDGCTRGRFGASAFDGGDFGLFQACGAAFCG